MDSEQDMSIDSQPAQVGKNEWPRKMELVPRKTAKTPSSDPKTQRRTAQQRSRRDEARQKKWLKVRVQHGMSLPEAPQQCVTGQLSGDVVVKEIVPFLNQLDKESLCLSDRSVGAMLRETTGHAKRQKLLQIPAACRNMYFAKQEMVAVACLGSNEIAFISTATWRVVQRLEVKADRPKHWSGSANTFKWPTCLSMDNWGRLIIGTYDVRGVVLACAGGAVVPLETKWRVRRAPLFKHRDCEKPEGIWVGDNCCYVLCFNQKRLCRISLEGGGSDGTLLEMGHLGDVGNCQWGLCGNPSGVWLLIGCHQMNQEGSGFNDETPENSGFLHCIRLEEGGALPLEYDADLARRGCIKYGDDGKLVEGSVVGENMAHGLNKPAGPCFCRHGCLHVRTYGRGGPHTPSNETYIYKYALMKSRERGVSLRMLGYLDIGNMPKEPTFSMAFSKVRDEVVCVCPGDEEQDEERDWTTVDEAEERASSGIEWIPSDSEHGSMECDEESSRSDMSEWDESAADDSEESEVPLSDSDDDGSEWAEGGNGVAAFGARVAAEHAENLAAAAAAAATAASVAAAAAGSWAGPQLPAAAAAAAATAASHAGDTICAALGDDNIEVDDESRAALRAAQAAAGAAGVAAEAASHGSEDGTVAAAVASAAVQADVAARAAARVGAYFADVGGARDGPPIKSKMYRFPTCGCEHLTKKMRACTKEETARNRAIPCGEAIPIWEGCHLHQPCAVIYLM